ncbi:MAG: phosphoribosylglycinamide formyltransferase [Leptolyngbyaceae bacterium]|nr:phosphoribosylglycinamide formyltransferase [Leptolyngbyaceae bacterium]
MKHNLLESQPIGQDATISSLISDTVLKSHYRAMPMRLGVLASGNGSNFQAIAEAIATRQLNASINVVIYNNREAGVAHRAGLLDIPARLIDHRDYSQREDLDHAIVAELHQHQVDWVIMAGWMRCVTTVLIHAFPGRILNIHPSLLPSFPGIRAVEQAIDAKVAVTGCTVHEVVLEVDQGPIIMQAAVPVKPDDTVDTLHQRIHAQEHRIYPLAIALAHGRVQSSTLSEYS